MWKFGSGVVVFLVRPDQEEIGIIVALEIGVQLGIKGESERFLVFTRMNLFLLLCPAVLQFLVPQLFRSPPDPA